jgi:hypothetical protein
MSLLETREAQSDTHQMTKRETIVPKLVDSCHKTKTSHRQDSRHKEEYRDKGIWSQKPAGII